MNKLITTEEIRDRLGIDPALAGGIDSVLESYIASAQLRMEAALESTFDAATFTDVFNLDSSLFGGVTPDGYFHLKLKTGFVQEDLPVVITWQQNGLYPDVTAAQAIAATDYYIDYEKGFVHVFGSYENMNVLVEYKAGFDDDHPAPDWLTEAILSAVLPLGNSLQANSKGSSAKDFYAFINTHVGAILDVHRRNVGFSMEPIA